MTQWRVKSTLNWLLHAWVTLKGTELLNRSSPPCRSDLNGFFTLNNITFYACRWHLAFILIFKGFSAVFVRFSLIWVCHTIVCNEACAKFVLCIESMMIGLHSRGPQCTRERHSRFHFSELINLSNLMNWSKSYQ